MAAVPEHYDTQLAPLNSWMSGGAEGPRERFSAPLPRFRDTDKNGLVTLATRGPNSLS
ncbi:MAG: hypothetical protein V4773_28410 [Verrucomicrobiota bacterium]